MPEDKSPLPKAPEAGPVTSDVVASGEYIPKIERVRLFDSGQWEDFVLEWADSFRDQYVLVERSGGAGDMGRDIIASCDEREEVWDNFQCKHYKSALTPSDVWIEIGKLIYYAFKGEFTYPRKYTFVAPQGAGTKLSKLLKKPDDLKQELIKQWDGQCKDRITQTASIPLQGELQDYLNNADFSVFCSLPPLRLIEEHSRTQHHVFRFGGGLPPRPATDDPPESIATEEVVYVRALLDAYESHLKRSLDTHNDLNGDGDLARHFGRSRKEFYSAESLRLFSRDTLPEGEFERLQEQIHDGIADEVDTSHADGYEKVRSVTQVARGLQITSHALVPRMEPRDRGGICHQLANDKKVRWVE